MRTGDKSIGQRTSQSSRRSFFTRGGALLGAGFAATAAGGTLAGPSAPPAAPQDPTTAAERYALKELQLAFAAHMESGRYKQAADLFTPEATVTLSGETVTGAAAIRALLAQYHRQSLPVLHRAYRQSAAQQQRDTVVLLSPARAQATFHVDVELCCPLQADCTAARMAQLQGGFAERRWEEGRLDVRVVKSAGQWRFESLSYHAA